jgi:chaperonin GroEL
MERAGFELVLKACQEPAKQIINNATGGSAKALRAIEQIENGESDPRFGFDSRSKSYCNLLEKGIIDPVKVVSNSL